MRRLADLFDSRFALVVGVVVGIAVGLWALGEALTWWLPAGIVVFGIVATVPELARGSLLLACAAVVAMLALIGFNVALRNVLDVLPDSLVPQGYRFPIPVGLIFAVAVFTGAAYFYLRGTWARANPPDWLEKLAIPRTHIPTPGWSKRLALRWAVILAVGVVIGLPPLVTLLKEHNESKSGAVPVAARIGSDLDVFIVGERRSPLPHGVPAESAREGFLPAYSGAVDLDARFGIGFARGRRVSWTKTGIADEREAQAALASPQEPAVEPPGPRARADTVIVLMVDATPPVFGDPAQLKDVPRRPGEVARWTAIARAAREAGGDTTPVYALLQTTDDARLQKWESFDELGGVVSIQRFGSRTATDAAVRLAVGASTAQEDFWLAEQHRPILLFDRDEPVPRPLHIERLFKEKHVRQCPDLSDGKCTTEPVLRAADLETPGMHLVIDRPKKNLNKLAMRERDTWFREKPGPPEVQAPEPGAPPPGTPPPASSPPPQGSEPLGDGSSIYVHPVSVNEDGRRRLYLDYWWYLPDNPTRAGKGAFCGAGLVILGVTCFDHDSDWEGVTVVIERSGEEWTPVAVHYAQHESVVRYEWQKLRAYWDADPGLAPVLTRIPDHAKRPLVFIAQGTHAAYARDCARECKQVATGREEGTHDGGLPWVGDNTEICLRVTCLRPLPTASGGRGPALWNAFEGPWGSRHCLWRYYCDSGTPPPAPGQQDRYREPAHYDGTGDVSNRGGGYEEADD